MASAFLTNHKLLFGGAVKLPGLLAVGLRMQRTAVFSKLPIDSGTFSFLLASVCATLSPNSVVLDSRIEELAWTVFLQSSLVLGLWKTELEPKRDDKTVNRRRWIPILVVFLIGTIGSLTGGFAGFHCANSKFSGTSTILSKVILSMLSACLTASYIGGTVNFFETAKILGSATDETKKSLINLVAGVDIGVMILYFWLLGVLRSSPIRILFPGSASDSPGSPLPLDLTTITMDENSSNTIPTQKKAAAILAVNYLPSIMAASLITSIANHLQGMISIPGTSVIFATLAGVGSMKLLKRTQLPVKKALLITSEPIVSIIEPVDNSQSKNIDTDPEKNSVTVVFFKSKLKMLISLFLDNLREHSAGASTYMMGLFYTTIGLGFRLDQAGTVSGPIGILIGVTLISHLCVILAGSLLWNSLIQFIAGLISKKSDTSDSTSVQDLLIDLDSTIIARYYSTSHLRNVLSSIVLFGLHPR